MSRTKILLIEDKKADTPMEQTLLESHYVIIKNLAPSLSQSEVDSTQKPDVVIFNIVTPTERNLYDIRKINQQLSLPIIIFATESDKDTISKVIKAGVSAFVVDDLRVKRISTVIEIAIARFYEQKTLKDELEKTKTKLEERKLTDRAKGILIKTRGFTEDEAYHKLRKLAMDRNIPIGEMAKNVISMAELLK